MSQNRARGASLDYIVDRGGVITDAVSTQDWPGDAAVDVSIVNWTKRPAQNPVAFLLDGVEVEGISTALRATGTEVSTAFTLPGNAGRCFYGPIPAGEGFILDGEEAEPLLELTRPGRCPSLRLPGHKEDAVFYVKVAFVLRQRLGVLRPGREWISTKLECPPPAPPPPILIR